MALRGESGWHESNNIIYGEERWPVLHESLLRDVEHLLFANRFLSPEAQAMVEREYGFQRTTIDGAYGFEIPEESAYRVVEFREEDTLFVEVDRDSSVPLSLGGLSPFFFIDGASVMAALALAVEEGDHVLDVCAAPGGKALVLASALFAGRHASDPEAVRGRLVCNDVSKEKAMRLQEIMRGFLPERLFDASAEYGPHVVFTAVDAGTPSNSMERSGPFDKILLDAPCLSDRQHLRGGTAKLGEWSASTSKVSSEKQLKWLYNALWLLKEGGVLLYCTTALSPDECDGVMERLMLKARGKFELEILPLAEDICRMVPDLASEATDWGTRILPDRTKFGPMYFCRVQLVRRTHEVAHC